VLSYADFLKPLNLKKMKKNGVIVSVSSYKDERFELPYQHDMVVEYGGKLYEVSKQTRANRPPKAGNKIKMPNTRGRREYDHI